MLKNSEKSYCEKVRGIEKKMNLMYSSSQFKTGNDFTIY